MYVVPSPETLMVWDAVFFVHQGSAHERSGVQKTDRLDDKGIMPMPF
jgi:hypothetical protein